MKPQLLLIFLFIFLLMGGVSAIVLPTTDNNMTVYYHLDNNSLIGENVTFVVDSSINFINSTFKQNAGFNISGYNGSCASFNGINYLQSQTSSGILNSSYSTFSIMAWIKPNDLLAKGGSDYEARFISKKSHYNFYFQNDSGGLFFSSAGLSDQTMASYSSIEPNTWTHVAFTYNGSLKSIYINGVLKSTESATGNIKSYASGALYIGGEVDSYNYNGSVDEIIISNYSYTSSEILDIYYNYTGGPLRTIYLPSVDNNMNLYYRFNNDSSIGENQTYVVDLSNNKVNGSYRSGNYPSINGYQNLSAYFNGTTYMTVSPSYAGILNSSYSTFSIMAWINPTNLLAKNGVNNEARFISKKSHYNFYFQNDSGGLFFSSAGLSDQTMASYSSIEPNTWTHVAFTYNGSLKSIYINGVLKSTESATGNIKSYASDPLYIGGEGDFYNYNGYLDELIISNRSYSYDDIIELYYNYTGMQYGECGFSPHKYLLDGCNITLDTEWKNNNFTFNGNIFLNDNLLFNITNVTLNMSIYKIQTKDNKYVSINISNSKLYFNSNTTGAFISLLRNSNLIVLNSIINGIYQIYSEGVEGIYFNNVTMINTNYSSIFAIGYSRGINILNSKFDKTFSASDFIRLGSLSGVSPASNSIISNNFFNNSKLDTITSYGSNNQTITNNTIINNGLRCVTHKNGNNTYVANNYCENNTWYAYDIYGWGNNILVENNVANNSVLGLFFSMSDGGFGNSNNLTSRNNKFYNIGYDNEDSGTALAWDSAMNGFSYNDYINNASHRGISIGLSENVYIENATVLNCVEDSFRIQWSSNSNVTIVNSTVINSAINFRILSSRNISIINMQVIGANNYNIISSSKEITYNNFSGYSFYILNSSSGGVLNITNYSISINQIDINQTIINNNQNNVTLFFNNSVDYLVFSNNEGRFGKSLNLTILPKNETHLYYNYQLTESRPLDGEPFSISSETSGVTKNYHIASLITNNITIPIQLNVDCNNLKSIIITPKDGISYQTSDYSCSGSTLILNNVNLSYSTSSNLIVINQYLQDQIKCTSFVNAFLSYIPFYGFLFAAMVFGIALYVILYSLGKLKSDVDLDNTGIDIYKTMVVIFIVILVITILVAMAYLINASMCGL